MANDSVTARFHEVLARAKAQVNWTASKRTPARSTSANNADNLERHMQEDGHTKWGWMIYRCTYTDDEQWQEFQERFAYWVKTTLDYDNGGDLLESMDIKVIEDKEAFDGASPTLVRRYFAPWAAFSSEEEQNGKQAGQSQRYRYCLHVDQEALDSVLAGPDPPDDLAGNGYVNLIMVPDDFDLEESILPGHETPVPGQVGPSDPDTDPAYMRISYTDLLVIWYAVMRADDAWSDHYCRPPEIAQP